MSDHYKNYQNISCTLKDTILWLTLNRPKAKNAIDLLMIEELCGALKIADFDNEVRVIVLTGSGDAFCAGGDIKDMENKEGMFAGEPNELKDRYQNGIQNIPRTIENLKTPIIAMVNGAAIGAGCDLSAMCDLRIVSKNAKFGETFAKLALVPGDGGTYFLPRVIGYPKAMEMFLTGKIYNAQEALEMGLANTICDADELIEKTNEVATRIASNSPIAVAMTKKALKKNYLHGLESALDLLAAYQGITQRTQDHFTGLDALKNRSQADFKGL
tara:strand:+ start:282755 stop:283570 length:816 start_codon:yes stop_codon:yes gene_type:complete